MLELKKTLVEGDINHAAINNRAWSVAGHSIDKALSPDGDNTRDLGLTTVGRWRNFFLAGSLKDDTNSVTVANLKTAYDHSQDNSQAHSDYLLNNANDTTSYRLTMSELVVDTSTLAVNLPSYEGRVGIGTNTPITIFNLHGTDPIQTITDPVNGMNYMFGSQSGIFRITQITSGGSPTGASTFLKVWPSSSGRMIINDSKVDFDFVINDDSGELSRFNAGTEMQEFPDNKGVSYGTTNKAEIYYLSGNLILDPDAVGSGKVYIGVTGNDILNAGAYEVGGVAGVNFNGAVTNITIVNGLVTAVS